MTARRRIAQAMADAVRRFLDTLEPAQIEAATWPFPADAERHLFFYTPTDHGGLALAEMTATQQRRVFEILSTGLSPAGFVTVATIIGHENVLDYTEGFSVGFGRERGRDPSLYWMSVFGNPDETTWSWRFGGHHVSLHYTIVDGELVGTTPSFLGADPAESPLLGPHLHRPLGAAEDLGRDLMHALDVDMRRQAMISPVAPADIVAVNRPVLRDGDTTLSLELLFRGRFAPELDEIVADMHRRAEEGLGLTAEHLADLSFSAVPKGIPLHACSDAHAEQLRALLDVYLDRIPSDLAAEEQAKYSGDGALGLHFAWAGGIERGEPHYYRIQGDDLFVEYDNTAKGANHVHAVWRDLRNDFGADALARHYAEHHH